MTYGYVPEEYLGNCSVQYGGQYKSIEGFQQAGCSREIQSANNIGFLCCNAWNNTDIVAMVTR